MTSPPIAVTRTSIHVGHFYFSGPDWPDQLEVRPGDKHHPVVVKLGNYMTFFTDAATAYELFQKLEDQIVVCEVCDRPDLADSLIRVPCGPMWSHPACHEHGCKNPAECRAASDR